MSPDTLNRLEKESQQPDDIAPVMGCGELRELLAERARLVSMVGALLGGVKMHAPRETYALVIEAAERTLGQVAP